MAETVEPEATKDCDASAGRGFFYIDRRTWAAVCDLQNLNAAIAYLVLASGTGGGNDVSRWSAKSLEKWMGMRRSHGKAAIECLIQGGVLAFGPEYTVAKPRYYLIPWSEIAGREPNRFQSGMVPTDGPGELIWLPNTLIRGVSDSEPAPVRKLRLADDLWSLRLLVDLYHAHFLQSDGGVPRQLIWHSYERKYLGEQGLGSIWGFKQKSGGLKYSGPLAAHKQRKGLETAGQVPAWDSIDRLERMGLVSFVPHAFPNENPQMEPLHSVGSIRWGAEPEEDAIRVAAHEAAVSMLQPGQVEQAYAKGFTLLLPTPKWLDQPMVVGLLRLRFRPHTSMTRKWYGDLVQNSPEWVQRYQQMRDEARGARPARQEWEAWGT